MGLQKMIQINAPDFFFPFDQDFDIDRELSIQLYPSRNGLQMRKQLSLVVRRTACEQFSVTNLWFKRGRGPQIQGIGRLHVIMSIDQNRRQTRILNPFSVDNRMALCGKDLSL